MYLNSSFQISALTASNPANVYFLNRNKQEAFLMNSLTQLLFTYNRPVVKVIYFHSQMSAHEYFWAIIARVEPAKPDHKWQPTLLESPLLCQWHWVVTPWRVGSLLRAYFEKIQMGENSCSKKLGQYSVIPKGDFGFILSNMHNLKSN